MTRVDAIHAAAPQPDKPRKRHGRGRGCFYSMFGCCSALIVVGVVVGGVTLYVAAKAGLVNVPILSKAVYEPPEPVRMVEAGDSESLMEELEYLIGTGGDIRITESELTALVRETMGESDEYVQTAIGRDGIEVFYKAPDPDNLSVIALIDPEIQAGKLMIDLVRVRIGGLSIPASALASLEDMVSSQIQEVLAQSFEQGAIEIRDITLQDGALILEF